MKKKILAIMMVLIILVTSISTIVFATTLASQAAIIYSPNMNFAATVSLGGLVSDVEDVLEYRDFTVTRVSDPEPLTLFSNLISKNVQLYFCHGGYHEELNEDGTTSIYNSILMDSGAALTTGPSKNYNIGGNSYTGYNINNVDMSHAKLVTLGACYSAGNGTPEFNSVAAKMWMNGAGAVLGWYDEVNTAQLIQWLKNYYYYLKWGYKFQEAIEYANTRETYAEGSNVQKCQLFVNKDGILVPDELIGVSSMINVSNMAMNEENLLELDSSKNLKIDAVEEIIEANDSNFDIDNYTKEEVDGLYVYNADTGINENVSRYINYHLKIGDFSTNSGYTVVLDKDGNIKKICDNTIDEAYSVANTTRSAEQFKVQESDIQNYLDKAKSEIKDKSNITDEKIKFTYDLKTNKKYANVTITFANSSPKTYTYEM